ncbi:MAG: hypothetical protein K0Q73_6442 [Paenibacillus sp.]|jgi:hypothetical protein|nr:hypothetical protein [Paenibacillus sp.]
MAEQEINMCLEQAGNWIANALEVRPRQQENNVS